MACTLAESLNDPLHRKLRQLRCLRRRFDCYRVERTSSRAGVAPAEVQRLSRRTFSPTTFGPGRLRGIRTTHTIFTVTRLLAAALLLLGTVSRTTLLFADLPQRSRRSRAESWLIPVT